MDTKIDFFLNFFLIFFIYLHWKASAYSGVIEIRDKWYKLLMYCHQYFLVVSMIWFSYTDNLYIKMIGYPWEIHWNHHHQHFLKQWKWHGCNLFWFLLPAQAKPNWAERLGSSCWCSPRCAYCSLKQKKNYGCSQHFFHV